MLIQNNLNKGIIKIDVEGMENQYLKTFQKFYLKILKQK